MSTGKYTLANRFYCSGCRLTLFIPADEGYVGSNVHCPLCGKRKARHTSSGWWVEKNKGG